MVLLMPAKVIAAVHRLAAACKKYKVIVFTIEYINTIQERKLVQLDVDPESGEEIMDVPTKHTTISGLDKKSRK